MSVPRTSGLELVDANHEEQFDWISESSSETEQLQARRDPNRKGPEGCRPGVGAMNPSVPLVLLPGHMCDEQMWEAQRDALCNVVPLQVIELQGRTSVEHLAKDVLAAAPPLFALAGFSLGGYTALEIMRQAPERIERLALLDTSARPDAPENKAMRLQNIALAQSGRLAEVLDAFALSTHGPVMRGHAGLAQAVRRMMGRHSLEHYAAQQQALITRPDARPVLQSIACPTLVACGADDGITTPEMHEEIARAVEHAVYVPIPEAGHMAPMEQPAVVTAILRYWLQVHKRAPSR